MNSLKFPLSECPMMITECPYHVGQEIYLHDFIYAMEIKTIGWNKFTQEFVFECFLKKEPEGKLFWFPASHLAPPLDRKPMLKVIHGGLS